MSKLVPDRDSAPAPLSGSRRDLLSELRDRLTPDLLLEREVGAGGMATVFLARDPRHEREVAVKVMHPEIAVAVGRTRFFREIHAISALLHPHILPLHQSGEVAGLLYYVMPFVSGGSLAERIGREKVIPTAHAVAIAREVADALAFSHERGIVHRDVKPSNILLPAVTHAFLADFGVAHFDTEGQQERLTLSGAALGSPAYMSPEQIEGSGAPDGKSDVYSLACVLYEMLTGSPPFRASSMQGLFLAHLTESPPRLCGVRPDLSEDLEEGILGALRKDPVVRTDAHSFERLLAAVQPASVQVGISSIGRASTTRTRVLVLPFLEHAPQAENATIGFGLTDEIITRLSMLDAFSVMSRSAALQLRGTSRDPSDLGAELNVRYVVEGSIEHSKDSLRIRVRLVRTEDEEVLWAQTFPGRMDELFEIEENVAKAIVAALSIRLNARQQALLARRSIPDARAYEYFLRAKQQVFAFTQSALEKGLEYLDLGEGLLGAENPEITAAKGYVYWQYYNAGISPDPANLDRANDCAARLLALDPESAAGHRLTGLIRVHQNDGNLSPAISHLRVSLAANPNDTDALFWLVLLYGFVGRSSSGYPLMKQLLSLDPLTPLHHILPGFLSAMDGNLENAVPLVRKAYQAEPDNPVTAAFFGQVLVMEGHEAEARAVFGGLIASQPDSFFAGLAGAYLAALATDHDGLMRIVAGEVGDACRGDMQYSWSIAQCMCMVGEEEKALEWLTNSTRRGFLNYPLLSRADPVLEPLRGTGAFRNLMSEIWDRWTGFEEQQSLSS